MPTQCLRSAVGREDDHGGCADMTMNVTGVGATGALWPDVARRVPAVAPSAQATVADKAGANPSGDLDGSLRLATVRRDAAPAAAANALAVQTTAEQLAIQRSAFTTPTSLAVTTAIAAYTAAAATAPPRSTSSGAAAPAARATWSRGEEAESTDEPPPYGGLLNALFGGYSSRP
jgi:hypothetical protein